MTDEGLEARYDETTRKLQVLQGPEELAQAPDLIGGFEQPKDRADGRGLAARRMKLDLWLVALNQLEGSVDRSFDFEHLPEINVAPPHSATLPSGVDPKDIKDPELRRRYEEAIRENAEKTERYNTQYRLKELDQRWFQELEQYVKTNYKRTTADRAEIRAAVAAHITDVDARARLQTALAQALAGS